MHIIVMSYYIPTSFSCLESLNPNLHISSFLSTGQNAAVYIRLPITGPGDWHTYSKRYNLGDIVRNRSVTSTSFVNANNNFFPQTIFWNMNTWPSANMRVVCNWYHTIYNTSVYTSLFLLTCYLWSSCCRNIIYMLLFQDFFFFENPREFFRGSENTKTV